MNRSRLLASCALASLVAFGRTIPASAQAFQGTPVTVAGSASVTRSPGVDTIDVASPQAVIDWTPSDTSSPTIDFLPAGALARYVGAPSLPGFTVLNRIIPASPAQVVAFNGAVISRLQDSIGNQTAGGAVWFYTPGGILVGATATFDVGGLLLTTADPIRDSFGNFLNFNTAQLRAAPGSLSGITIAPGARIDALPEDSYLALVAPRITQSGTATVNGGVAYVAAEAVDLTINRGTFDIGIVTGSAASGDALIHDGVTTGPASSDVTDPHRIYMVAVPQNDAITLLLSGRAGFDPATVAGVENGAVVLSAGRSVFFDQTSSTPLGTAEADIRITGGDFTSRVFADSSGSTKAGAEIGNLNFASDILLSANRTAELRAVNGNISVGGNATVQSAVGDRTAGTAAIFAEIGKTIVISGDANVIADGGDDFRFNILPGDIGRGGTASIGSMGAIQIGGSAFVSAQGRALFSTPGDGFDAFGGDASIVAQNGGGIAIALGAQVLTNAFGGGSDNGVSGDALGGTVTIRADGGMIDIGGPVRLNTLAFSGPNVTGGGSVTGGTAVLASANGGNVHLADRVELVADGIGAFSSGIAGAATGGTVEIRTSSGGTITAFADLSMQAGGFSGPGAGSGDARGGIATIALNSGSLGVGSVLDVSARGSGAPGSGIGGRAFGGSITLSATGALLTVGADTHIEAGAFGGSGASGGAGSGGTVSILSAGSTLGFGTQLSVGAAGNGGTASSGAGGAGIGGSVSILSDGDGSTTGVISGNRLQIFVYGGGGDGISSTAASIGGDGRGGNITIATAAGSVGFADAFLDLGGHGGQGGGSDMIGGNGGLGVGGNLTLDAAGGPFSLATLFALADGFGGVGGFGMTGGGTGANATGGTITAFARAGVMSLGDANFNTRAVAGFGGGSQSGPIGNGGTAMGGSILFGVDGATALLTGNALSLYADAQGGGATAGTIDVVARLGSIQFNDALIGARGDGSGSGLATGGTASISTVDGTIAITGSLSLEVGANGGFTAATANGGSGQGGNILVTTGNGAISSADLFLNASGHGALGSAPGSGDGGYGRGGTIAMLTNGGSLTVTGSANLGADGIGGSGGSAPAGANGGNGAPGTGGSITVTSRGGAMSFGHLGGGANGMGGFGGDGDIGGAGGLGRGGSILVRADGAPVHAGDALFGAEGNGGFGGNAVIGAGGIGGDGFGGSVDMAGRTGSAIDGNALNLVTIGRGGSGGSGGGNGGAGGNATGGVSRLAGFVAFGSTHVGASAFGGGGGMGGIGGAGGSAFGGSAEIRAFDGDMALGHLFADAFAHGGSGATGGDASGGTARLFVGSDLANAGTSGNFSALGAHLGAGSDGGLGFSGDSGDARGGTAAILANGGTIFIAEHGSLSARASGGFGDGSGDALGGSAAITLTGGAINFGAGYFIEADAFGGDGNVQAATIAGSAVIDIGGGTIIAAEELVVSASATGGSASGGTALVTATGGTLAARDLFVTASAFGTSPSSTQPSGPSGGNGISTGPSTSGGPRGPAAFGGSATGGTARIEASGGTLSISQHIGIVASAHGGEGAIAGGSATGGQAALAIGGTAQVNAGDGFVSAGAFGGRGVDGSDGPSGGTGGNGGLATAGSATVAAIGGSFVAANVHVDAVAHGGDGGFGGAGAMAGNSGGTGGNGATGTGGTAKVEAAGGALSFGSLALIADGQGGNGGLGGEGAANPDGSVTTAIGGNGASGRAGTVSISTRSTGKLQGGDSFLSANGLGGIDASGNMAAVGVAGRILVTAGDAGAAGTLGFRSLFGRAHGMVVGSAPTVYLHSTGQTLSIDQLLDISADGDALVQSGGGQIRAFGDAFLDMGGSVAVNGAVDVAGLVDVRGSSVSIDVSGPLRIGSVAATGGAASIVSGGDLEVAAAFAATSLGLTSRNSALRSNLLLAGGDLRLSAAGLVSVKGSASAANITVASADLELGDGADLRASASLALQATGGAPMTIGGTGSVSGYSLDAAEFARLSAPRLIVSAPTDISLLDMTIAGSASATPMLSTLRIQTPGTITVAGRLALADAGTSDRVELSAARRIGVVTPAGAISLRGADGGLAGTLALESDNIVVASEAASADLASASLISARKQRLATNDGAATSAGYLEAGAIMLKAGRTLHVQNSGTATELAGLTVGAGGLSVAATGLERTEMILYGRAANADGNFVTGDAFIPAVARSGDFDLRSTINGCLLNGSCLGTPPEPVLQAIAATVDTVIAVIAAAQASDGGAVGGGSDGSPGAPSNSQSVTRTPNIVLGELLDFTPFKMQGPIEGPVTGAGNDDLGAIASLPPAELPLTQPPLGNPPF